MDARSNPERELDARRLQSRVCELCADTRTARRALAYARVHVNASWGRSGQLQLLGGIGLG